jgi:uncharacterized protein (TIGR03083 family)
MFPGERDLRVERAALVETMESLSDERFESGPTLCEGWTPRDVLAHVVGTDLRLFDYVRALGSIDRGNARIVEALRPLSRAELTRTAHRWAARPALASRIGAYGLLGDNAMHHQDVLRPLGRTRDIPEASRRAILREGMVLGAKRLLTYRVEPTDVGRPAGRGRVVRGTAEALGMWLAGRGSVAPELDFQ